MFIVYFVIFSPKRLLFCFYCFDFSLKYIRMVRLKKRISKSKKSFILLFVNRFMREGKKDFMYKNFLLVLIYIKKRLKLTFDLILERVLDDVRPLVQLKPKFVSGIIYLLPSFVSEIKSKTLGLSWLVRAVRMRSEEDFKERLVSELYEILNQRGFALSYRREYYKLCLNNRALLFKFKNK